MSIQRYGERQSRWALRQMNESNTVLDSEAYEAEANIARGKLARLPTKLHILPRVLGCGEMAAMML